ncbi:MULTISPECIES: branched-chain amino acid ABC transporter substrate-binding protein [Bordetella]|uniref:Branched-chain amino acid ABC transporter substrate-binding protein n=2 Tax=Bordetella TaxID=517 RepID=A0A261W8I0_9BORD|nr:MULTISPECIES: branched-chain amino acid ABC transporter substrate-binding protein [Bordetella]MDM9562048.1 branched-chain amino acid ABC transporter substrate-binding protein [Bordetella petrii]OZI82668.1 branched-chain amino acid ABC transporter substrate-binding protein [Bordetella genomosp. 2]
MKLALTAGALCVAGLAAAAQAAPVKIGLIETLSGPQASTGQMFRAAIKYELDRINAAGGWNGEPLQLVEFDNQGGPVGASDRFRAAAADGVQIIAQGASSAISGQLTEDVRKYNLRNPGKEIVFLNMGGEALELTGEKCNFYHFRFTTNAELRVKALTAVMAADGTLGKRVYAINQNYSWGQDMESATERYADDYGYQVVGKTLHEVNKIQDFAPYVARIRSANPDTVITGNWSNDLLLLMKATQAGGLKVRFGTVFLDQVGNLANAGEVALGHYIAHPFNAQAAGEEGARFAEDYKAKTGHYPSYVEPQTVMGMRFLGQALKQVQPRDGRLPVPELARALEQVTIKTALGEYSMRAADHQVQLPMVVSKVTKTAQYKTDGTDMGFEPVKVLAAADVSAPVQGTCKMARPD